MKLYTTIFLSTLFLNLSQSAFGQKSEYNINAYGGLFFFSGPGSTTNSTLNLSKYGTPSKFTTNPYGNKSKFSYSLEAEVKQFVYPKFFQGVSVAFEKFVSRVHIDTIRDERTLLNIYPANGTASLHISNVSLSYFIGYRFMMKKSSLDLSLGGEVAITFETREKVNLFDVNNLMDRPKTDVRPKLQLKLNKNKFGFLLGYSHGLVNYQLPFNNKAFTNYIRAGVSYKIR